MKKVFIKNAKGLLWSVGESTVKNGTLHLKLVCKHGGSRPRKSRAAPVPTMLLGRPVAKRKRKEEKRCFSDESARLARCKCTKRVVWCMSTGKCTEWVSDIQHNHEPNRTIISLSLIELGDAGEGSFEVTDRLFAAATLFPEKTTLTLMTEVYAGIEKDYQNDEDSAERIRLLGIASSAMGDPRHMDDLESFVRRSRKGQRPLTIEGLHNLVEDRVPANPDEPFLIGTRHADQGGLTPSHFCVSLSTTNWLKRATEGMSSVLMIDGCHSVTNESFKLILIGTESHRNSFFPLSISIVYEESEDEIGWCLDFLREAVNNYLGSIGSTSTYEPEVILFDGARGIEAACKKAFPRACLRTCFFHMVKAFLKQCSSSTPSDILNRIRGDLHILSSAMNKTQFLAYTQQFLQKWENEPAAADAIKFLKDNEYLNPSVRSGRWYYGAPVTPAHLWHSRSNNPTENYNRRVKASRCID